MDSYDFIKEGKYKEACDASEKEFQETGVYQKLIHKALALLNMKQYNETILILERIIANSDFEADYNYSLLGVSKWALKDYKNAFTIWISSLNTAYTDAAGGIIIPSLIYSGSIINKDPEMKKIAYQKLNKILKKNSRSFSRTNPNTFPGPIGAFLINMIEKKDLMNVTSKNKILKQRQLCQVFFYIGIKSYEKKNKEKAKKMLENSIKKRDILSPEYYFAQIIVERNFT